MDLNTLLFTGNRSDWQGILYCNWEGKTCSIILALSVLLLSAGGSAGIDSA